MQGGRKNSVVDDIVKGTRKDFERRFPLRLKQVGLIISGWDAPKEIDEYLNEAHVCYLHGIFIASMIMAVTAIESSLRIKYTEITNKKKVKPKKSKGEFEYLVEWAKQNSVIDQHQADKINKIRKFPRNRLVHIKPFRKNEVDEIFDLLGKEFEELSNEERRMVGEYLFRTDPSERFARKVLEIADEIVMHIFPSIGRIPFNSEVRQ